MAIKTCLGRLKAHQGPIFRTYKSWVGNYQLGNNQCAKIYKLVKVIFRTTCRNQPKLPTKKKLNSSPQISPIIFVYQNVKLETLHTNISGLGGHKIKSKGCLEVRKTRRIQLSYSPDLSGNFNFIDNMARLRIKICPHVREDCR